MDFLPHDTGLSPEQLQARLNRIGASDVAAVLGHNRWESPYTAWLNITGQAEPKKDNEAMAMGRDLEEGLLRAVCRKRDSVALMRPGTVLKDEWAAATPDGIMEDDPTQRIGVEVKNRGLNMAKEFRGHPGEAGDGKDYDLIPRADLMQCQWGMWVTDLPAWWFCIFFGGADFRTYWIPRHDGLIEGMVQVAHEWWKRHVDPNGPRETPEVDGHEATTEHLKIRFPTESGEILPALPEHLELAARYADLDGKYDELKLARDGIKNKLIAAIGDAKGIAGIATHGLTTRKPTVDWEAVVKALELLPAVKFALPSLLAEHQKPRSMYRTFRFNWQGE